MIKELRETADEFEDHLKTLKGHEIDALWYPYQSIVAMLRRLATKLEENQ